METPLCTCNHPAHIFACWGDNGECACREHAVASVHLPDGMRPKWSITPGGKIQPLNADALVNDLTLENQALKGSLRLAQDNVAYYKLYLSRRPVLCDAQNGDSEFFCNLPKGHAADHQSVNLSGNGGAVGWSNRR